MGGAWNARGIQSLTLRSGHSSHGVQGEGLGPHLWASGWSDHRMRNPGRDVPPDSGPPIRGLRGCCQLSTTADHARMNRPMGWRVIWGCIPALSRTPWGAGLPGLWIMSTSERLSRPAVRKSLPFLTSCGHLVFLDPRLAGWLGDEYKKETRVLWVMILWL